MQTFLPYPDFTQSARVLDRQRLGKQRVEAWMVLEILQGKDSRWSSHPAVRMWRGYAPALMEYGMAMCFEWKERRGYNDTLLEKFRKIYWPERRKLPSFYGMVDVVKPPWLGDEDFHRSHQSNLVRKLPDHYGPLFPNVPSNLPYIWPV